MKVCDRCKEKLDSEKGSSLEGEHFDLCSACAKHISDHIKNYKTKQGGMLSQLFSGNQR